MFACCKGGEVGCGVAPQGSVADTSGKRAGDKARGDAMEDSKLKRDRLYPVPLPDVSADAPNLMAQRCRWNISSLTGTIGSP